MLPNNLFPTNKEKIMNYRRFIFAVMAALLVCAFAVAQEDGIGLTAKAEFGIGNINEGKNSDGTDAKKTFVIVPGLEYENSFLDEALDVFAEVDYTIEIPTEDDGKTTHVLYLEEEVGYNLGLGEAMTLSIILNNQNNITVSPEVETGFNPFDGVLEPSLKFAFSAGFGEIWAQAGLPIGYAAGEGGASKDGGDTTLDAYLTLAYYSTFGLGIELTPNLALSPDSDYAGFDILVNYENGPIYAEVEVNLPKKIDDDGVTVTPEFDYSLNSFTFYVKSEFGGIGLKEGDVQISPALGVKYSF
jgi:hypothetical protein